MKNFFGYFGLMLLGVTCLVTCRTASTNVPLQEAQTAKQAQPVDGWRVFTPPDKSFSVELPCSPTETNVSAKATPIYEYSCGGEDKNELRFFGVSAFKIKDPDKPANKDQARFERSVTDSFPENKRIIKLITLKMENGIGAEFVVTNKRDEMDNLRGRVMLIGGRRYEVMFGASDLKALDSPDANRFFASFKPLQ